MHLRVKKYWSYWARYSRNLYK